MAYRKHDRQSFLTFTVACASLAWLATAPSAWAESSPAKFQSSDKFSSSTAAAQHCPADTVVWSTFSKSKVFHLSGSKYYGKTRHGAFVCEKDAVAAGYHASKR